MLPIQTLSFISLFISLFVTLNRIVDAATSKELIEQRQKNGYQECVDGWKQRINDRCTYPGQDFPCLKEPKDTKTFNAEEFTHICCSSRCQNLDIETLCCRDRSCLDKCYKKLRMHKLRNTASLEKRSRQMFETTTDSIDLFDKMELTV